MLGVESAAVRFGTHDALGGVDLEVAAGETIAVLGPSGSGKTTLLRAIAGLQPLDAGRVTWNGDDLAAVPAHRRRFGLMFQEYALFPHRDVAGNVEFGLRMAGVPKPERAARLDAVLDLVGLRDQSAQRVASLSGGEQQRVALARALVVSPRLLMLDEPLGALDRTWRTRLLNEIRSRLDDAALPALYVTHDHDEALTIAHRVAIMRAGRIVQIDAPAAVWRRPADPWVAEFLGFGPTVRAEVHDGQLCLPWGALPALRSAGPGIVVLRPDAARLDADGRFAATVTRVTFAGATVGVALQPDAGPPLSCAVPIDAAPPLHARVRWSIEANALLCYPDQQD
jgi:thiamine transport system ATP-binding protein